MYVYDTESLRACHALAAEGKGPTAILNGIKELEKADEGLNFDFSFTFYVYALY